MKAIMMGAVRAVPIMLEREHIPKCLSDILCDLKFLSLVERKTPLELSRKDKL